MTRNPKRAAVALAILVLTLLTLVYMNGCASMRPDFTWAKTEEASARHEWIQVSWARMFELCRIDPTVMANLGACAFNDPGRTCRVYSFLPEQVAKLRISGDGESLFDHELRHCAGWRHY